MKYKNINLMMPRLWFFLTYVFLAIVFWYSLASPYLNDGNLDAVKLFPDTLTYSAMCGSEDWRGWYFIRSIGPCLQVLSFGHKYYILFLFNSLLIVLTIKTLASNYSLQQFSVAFLLLINPITFLSLFSFNKEIFGLYSIALMLSFLKTHRYVYIPFVLVFAIFSRLPMFLVLLIFFVVFFLGRALHGPRNKKASKTFIFLYITAVISVLRFLSGKDLVYTLLGYDQIVDFNSSADISTATRFSLGMESFSEYGLFVITYVCRLGINLFSALLNFQISTIALNGFYYTIGVIGSSFIFLLYFILAIFSKFHGISNYSDRKWIFILFLVYTLIYCLSPTIQHRYFYPLLPIFVIAIAKSQKRLTNDCL